MTNSEILNKYSFEYKVLHHTFLQHFGITLKDEFDSEVIQFITESDIDYLEQILGIDVTVKSKIIHVLSRMQDLYIKERENDFDSYKSFIHHYQDYKV